MERDTISRKREARKVAGFTLIEMLVACAVLSIVVVLVAQMVSSATSVTGASRKRVDADDQARMVFDRMEGDFAQMLKRSDIDPILLASSNSSANGNAELYFYSQAPAYSDINTIGTNDSGIALIGYQVMSNGLARLGIEQSWANLSFSSNVLSALVSSNQIASQSASTATNYHIIAPGVFRMEFALLMKPGSTNNYNTTGSTNPPAYTTSATTNGTNVFFQTNNAGQGLKDVAAIVVALAILDPTSQQIVTSSVTNLVSIMPNASVYPSAGSGTLTGASTNGIPTSTWKTNALTQSVTGVPQAARAQIRIYQRTFPITP